jgi:uncharacterized protein (TIGR03790 family)
MMRPQSASTQSASYFPGFIKIAAAIFIYSILPSVSARAELLPSQVLLLVNHDTPISSEVAQMYQKRRGVPANNVLTLAMGTKREITRQQYQTQIAEPVKKFLQSRPGIRCILTTAGIPYTMQALNDEGAAVDNELATVLRDPRKSQAGELPNPLFLYGSNVYGLSNPRQAKMIFVARLDGPDIKTITRMVDDAVAAEKTGLAGPVYGDARGIQTAVGYGIADASIRAAIDIFAGAGFETSLDLNDATWTAPSGSVSDEAAGAAFYVGWYKLRDFQNIFGQQGLAKGSIAWHVASEEAVDLWDKNEKGWCVNLLRRGAAVTLGAVREPLITAFPRTEIFAQTLLSGASVAEAYWLALPHVSWNMVLLGDPLYRPFGVRPRPTLTARAYIASDADQILERNQTSGLLVQIECIGPPGSSTSTVSATVERGMGLTAASGTVTIPPMRAGQVTVVRVPSVTAGADPSGIFRLTLNGQGGTEKRSIILEGRVGFTRVTGGVLGQSQMSVSPDGKFVISGEPGRAVITEVKTLRSRPVNLRGPLMLTGAEFAPDSAHVAVTLTDPQQKPAGYVITDGSLNNGRTLPQDVRFVRWLSAKEMLLRAPNSLQIQDVQGLNTRVLDVPAGWSTASVIPGSAAQVLVSPDGKLAFRRGSEVPREVLQGVKAASFVAVANDLSMFGAVDPERRLWVQRAIGESPQVVANNIAGVLWGPVSHRALVKDAAGNGRVYDGRDNSWIDLGVVGGAEWSRDEERLLFIQSEGKGEAARQHLALLNGRKILRLAPADRLGPIARFAFPEDRQKAFMLAGMAGRGDVWIASLNAQPEPVSAPQQPERQFVIPH